MVRKLPRKRLLETNFTVRFTKEQRLAVEAAARSADLRLGAYVREVVLADALERITQDLDDR